MARLLACPADPLRHGDNALTYNAGNPAIAPGDSLTLTGGTWDSVTYNHTNASSGTVQITKASIGAGTALMAAE